MTSPYEEGLGRLVKERKARLAELEAQLGKKSRPLRRLEERIEQVKSEIAFLEERLERYGKDLDWLRKAGNATPPRPYEAGS